MGRILSGLDEKVEDLETSLAGLRGEVRALSACVGLVEKELAASKPTTPPTPDRVNFILQAALHAATAEAGQRWNGETYRIVKAALEEVRKGLAS